MLLQDRLLDVATYMTAVPASQIVEVETSIPMHVLELDPDVMERFRAEHPEYQKYVVPAGTYKGQDKDVETVSVVHMILCRADLDEDVVYEITKSMWENISDITAIHATIAKEMTLDGACRSMVAELHPGAERYYQALIDHYYRKDNTLLSVLEYEMEYAGPKEAIHHAIMRKNFGCTHMIIGRDHAGVGNFYSPYAAQEIFREFPDLEIQPIILNSFFFCKKCEAMANEKTCPHPQCDHVDFSGTKIRKFFTSGDGDLTGLMRPEVVREIMNTPNRFVD